LTSKVVLLTLKIMPHAGCKCRFRTCHLLHLPAYHFPWNVVTYLILHPHIGLQRIPVYNANIVIRYP